jgi:biotin synthase-like enzyme
VIDLHAIEEHVLGRGEPLAREDAMRITELSPDRVPELCALAHRVRLAHCGPEVSVESIVSAKTGGCSEDCAFCSQSARFPTPVRAAWLDVDGMVEAARSFFPEICTSHSFDDRYETCLRARGAGMELCSGGVVGMGETWEQRVELAYDLASLDPDEVPLNFLNPRPGTPLEGRDLVEPLEALKAIALFRLVLPRATLRYAGGREVTLRELQALGLVSGINALIVGNYLTTLGRSVEDDLRMLEDLRMPLRPLAEAL